MAAMALTNGGEEEAAAALIDALPYADGWSWNPEMQAVVEEMVEAELRSVGGSTTGMEGEAKIKTQQEYYDELVAQGRETMHGKGWSALVEEEMARVARGEQLEGVAAGALATAAAAPRGKAASLSRWQESTAATSALIEHGQVRLLNLELMAKHGGKVWRARNALLEAVNGSSSEALNAAVREAEVINLKRQTEQREAGSKLHALTEEVGGLVEKCAAIEAALEKRDEETKMEVD